MVGTGEQAVEHIMAGLPRQHVAARPAGPPEAVILTPLAPALAPDVESDARQATGKPKQPEDEASGCYARPHNYARRRKRKLARPNPEARRQQQFPPVRTSPYYHNLYSAPEPGHKSRGELCLNLTFGGSMMRNHHEPSHQQGAYGKREHQSATAFNLASLSFGKRCRAGV
jgi:hypothetical protein